MKKSKVFYNSKAFLNRDGFHSDATIFCSFDFWYRGEARIKPSGHSGEIRIRDCSSTVVLSLGVDNEGDDSYENSIEKIDTMIKELSRYKVALGEARIEYEIRKKAEEEEEEEDKLKKEANEDNKSNSGSDLRGGILQEPEISTDRERVAGEGDDARIAKSFESWEELRSFSRTDQKKE